MSNRKKSIYLSEIGIAGNVTKEFIKRINQGIMASDLLTPKFEKEVEEGIDSYSMSSTIEKDGERYIYGYIIRESGINRGKIDRNTDIKDIEKIENDEGIRFLIDLYHRVIVYTGAQRFGVNQFNTAMSYILNDGLKKLNFEEFKNVEMNINNIMSHMNIDNIQSELENLTDIKELKVKHVMSLEASREFNDKTGIAIEDSNHSFKNDKIGINLSKSNVKEAVENIILINNFLNENIDKKNKINGYVEISGKTMSDISFGTGGRQKLIYQKKENNIKEKQAFYDVAKDIIDDYKLKNLNK